MTRRVQTVQFEATGAGAVPDGYFDKIVKYIPADIVAAWVAISALVKGATGIPVDTVLWISFAVGLVLTAWWTWTQTSVPGQPPAVKQIIISTLAFAVWVFAIGAPFDTLGWYRTVYASILLIGYTLVIGKINP
jgi:hypothetical protein